MPNRIIKESINESRGLTSCTFFAQDLYKRLITYADDYGRFNADPQIMIARLYPRELSVVSLDDLNEGIIELVGVDKIRFYTAQPKKEVYGCFPNWGEHQRTRESKKKYPDPEDTTVNDWYLRRYVSSEMKAAVITRDAFKCQQCGKHVAEITDAYRLVKMSTGSFHIDHIVPCNQGGRATLENLRLLCAKCNLSRKKTFFYDEILEFAETGGELPQSAETGGELPRVSAVIQSNPNPNPNSNPKETPAQAREASAPAHAAKGKYGEYGWVRLTQEEYSRLLAEIGQEELVRCIQYVDESAQKSGNKNRWKDWNLVIRSCHREGWGLRHGRQGGTPDYAKPVDAEKAQADLSRMERLLEKMGGGE